jgi:hypothetical protein
MRRKAGTNGATIHFCARALERWGFIPTRREFQQMRVAWATGQMLLAGNSVYLLELRGRLLYAVIKNASFVTALNDRPFEAAV